MIEQPVAVLSDSLTSEAYDLSLDARAHAPLVVQPGKESEKKDRCAECSVREEPTSVFGTSRPSRIRPVRGERVSLARRRLRCGEPFVAPEGHSSRFYHASTRVFDVVGTIVLLAVLWPVLLSIYLLLMVTTRGKPFFKQKRLGYEGKPFTMVKFRTMTLDAESRRGEVENEKDGPIFKNRQDARVTRLGRFLRSTSLDETPQLFNVLLGQMSLVGPRPPIGDEVAEYEPWQRRRLSVKPGLTCLWQVSGRSEIEFEDWMRMDLWYVRHQNWSTDLELLVRTPWSVLSRRGAY